MAQKWLKGIFMTALSFNKLPHGDISAPCLWIDPFPLPTLYSHCQGWMLSVARDLRGKQMKSKIKNDWSCDGIWNTGCIPGGQEKPFPGDPGRAELCCRRDPGSRSGTSEPMDGLVAMGRFWWPPEEVALQRPWRGTALSPQSWDELPFGKALRELQPCTISSLHGHEVGFRALKANP